MTTMTTTTAMMKNVPRALQATYSQASSSRSIFQSYTALRGSTISASRSRSVGIVASLKPIPTFTSRGYTTTSTRGQASSSSTYQPMSDEIPSISPEDTFDIIIIGGGNAGLALACGLREYPSPPAMLSALSHGKKGSNLDDREL